MSGSDSLFTPLSPATSRNSIPSPSLNSVPLPGLTSSPSIASNNRFGLSLSGFIQRRPRGQSANGRVGGPISPDLASTGPISPIDLGNSNQSSSTQRGYGFPSLRRQLNKRPGSSGTINTNPQQESTGNTSVTSLSSSPRPLMRRSTSQPRTPLTESAPAAQAKLLRPHTSASSTPSVSFLASSSNPTASSSLTPTTDRYQIRLVPHLESNRSLHFDPVDRTLAPYAVVSIGRFTDRSVVPTPTASPTEPTKVAFKSKVVSRGHADVWTDNFGKFFIKDTKSSSGTFLNHIRLSGPGLESKPFPLKDGDILQLGVDYQGGTEEIYRCVKMRVELNRGWQKKKSSFNTNALKQLRELGNPVAPVMEVSTSNITTVQSRKSSSVTDCCICLYPVTVCQALFIAPCSHVTHFACIRPLINKTYPGHTCPVCRTYADLEADVTIDEESEVEEEMELEEEEEEVPAGDQTVVIPSGRAGSILEVFGPGGVTVPLYVSAHRADSRPASVRSGRSGKSGRGSVAGGLKAMTLDDSTPTPEPSGSLGIAIPSSNSKSSAASLALEESLFTSVTPSNTVFLSTLAETRTFNSRRTSTPNHTVQHDFDIATSSTTPMVPSDSTSGETEASRRASSSSEGETDGTVEIIDRVNKGKGKETRSTGLENHGGSSSEVKQSVERIVESNTNQNVV